MPVSVEVYVEHVGAVLRRDADLDPDEPGWSFQNNGKHYICVNARDPPERQSFTICHELAHIVWNCPRSTSRSRGGATRSARRMRSPATSSRRNCCCPTDSSSRSRKKPPWAFRPSRIWPGSSRRRDQATGSSFTPAVGAPCAFVLSEIGKVRYASRSRALRDIAAWIPPGTEFRRGSPTERGGGICDGAEEITADNWFNDWSRGGLLLDEACHFGHWDQTLTLLWFDGEEAEPQARVEDLGLRELDGILPWPGTKRRE